MIIRKIVVLASLVTGFSFSVFAVELTKSTIVPISNSGVTLKAAEILQEHIEKRSGLILPIVESTSAENPNIILGTVKQLGENYSVLVPESKDSFAIQFVGKDLVIVGRDDRGVVYGAGQVIRIMNCSQNSLVVDIPKSITGEPDVPYRAHQLGYRNTANSYDAWSIEMFEQYIRELAIFGANGVELIPKLDPTEKEGEVMAEPIRSMNLKISQVLKDYGMDVWLWFTVMNTPDEDVTHEVGIQKALDLRREIFKAYPKIDHLFVPGGDGGDTPVEHLLPFLKRLRTVLDEYHPQAKIWVSNQTFTIKDNIYFFDYLASGDADWLHGVVYGPWTKMSWEQIRARTPEKFPIRRYPDITHTVRCQYALENWDPIWANTAGREPVMPMPIMQQHIYHRYLNLSDGFGTYSDGIHDDFNKILWSVYGWNRDFSLDRLLLEYGKVFFGDILAKDVASGLLELEKNWKGPVRNNTKILKTQQHWETIARKTPEFSRNWRAQMYLFRARFDANVQAEAKAQELYEQEAYASLAQVKSLGVKSSIAQARTALAKADTPANLELRKSIEELGPLLLESIGYQLSEKAPYYARNSQRGAMLDWLDQSLNDRQWLEQQFERVLALDNKDEQLTALEEIVNWTDPGPGGFYDNLGSIGGNTHVLYQDTWENDPSGSHSPRIGFPYYKADPETVNSYTRQELRMSWQSQIATHYGTPLKLRYEDLDSKANYTLRVTYAGRYRPTMTLTVDDMIGIHGPVKQPNPIWPVEYDIPRLATMDGTLDLEWNLVDGRGCMVAEIWLIKQ